MDKYPDGELMYLVHENNEEALNIIYEKYKYIVDIIYNKYRTSAYSLSVEPEELKQEALVGFSDAIVSYNEEKEASLPTFITLVVERRVRNFIKSNDTTKAKMLRDTYSLDHEIGEDLTLMETIGSDVMDPQITYASDEETNQLKEKIERLLSDSEVEVYELLINGFNYSDICSILNISEKQVYNYVSRIRSKIKKIINKD